MQAAHRVGLQATQYNNANFDHLAQHFQKGKPAIVLLQYHTLNGEGPHFFNVIGMGWKDDKSIKQVFLVNPHRNRVAMSYEKFMQQWTNVSCGGTSLGRLFPTYQRNMVLISGRQEQPLPVPTYIGHLTSLPENTLANGINGFSASVHDALRGYKGAAMLRLSTLSPDSIV